MAICQNCGNNVCINGKIWMEKEDTVFVFCKNCRLQVKVPVKHGYIYLLNLIASKAADLINLN